MLRKPITYVVVALWLVGLAAFPALAHKALIWADVTEGVVQVRSYYHGGGAPIKDAKYSVLDQKGTLVVSGKTDKDGRFQFDVPQTAKTLTLAVQDLMGHRATLKLTEKELHPEK